MDDTHTCPICNTKMRLINHENKLLYSIGKTADYRERICSGMNHSIQLFAEKKTGKVDFITLSLNPKYSRFLEIDFVNQKCRINCFKEGKPEYITIAKMIQPDFPKLERLKQQVSLYITFS